jgi:voltage-gated potassium channel
MLTQNMSISQRGQEIIVTILIAASVLFIGADYLYSLPGYQQIGIYIFDLAVVVILAKEFYSRMKRSNEQKIKFLVKHVYEIPAMLPLFVFGIIEAQTLITTNPTIWNLEVIKLFRLLHLFFRTIVIFREHIFLSVITFTLGAIISGAFALYLVEADVAGSKIVSLGDALWLVLATVTTVGFGDLHPITTEGKIITSILMFVGIGIVWAFIFTLGNNLIQSRLNILRTSSINKGSTAQNKIGQKKEPDKGLSALSSSSSMPMLDDTKALIISKINNIDKLKDEEVEFLIGSIRNLYYHSVRKSQ